MRACTLLLAPVLVLVSSTARAGDLWVVDQSGGGDFSTLSAACTAASDGDSIVIVGDYTVGDGILLDGKGLSIVHDEVGGTLHITGITVRNLPAGSDVLISNFRVYSLSYSDLRLTNCDGRIVIDGLRSTNPHDEFPAVVTSCEDVVLTDCRLHGINGYPDACDVQSEEDGYPALHVRGASRVSLYDCDLEGGRAGWNFCYFYEGVPGPGLLLEDTASAFAAGSNIEGGDEYSCCGEADPVIATDQAEFTEYTGPPALLIGPWLESEGDVSTLRVQGPPGYRVLLLVGSRTAFRALGPKHGIVHVDQPPAIPIGWIPANGLLSFPFPQPQLPPGVEAELLHAQVVLGPPTAKFGGAIWPVAIALSNPKTWVVRN